MHTTTQSKRKNKEKTQNLSGSTGCLYPGAKLKRKFSIMMKYESTIANIIINLYIHKLL